jgi:hypothetical protein
MEIDLKEGRYLDHFYLVIVFERPGLSICVKVFLLVEVLL